MEINYDNELDISWLDISWFSNNFHGSEPDKHQIYSLEELNQIFGPLNFKTMYQISYEQTVFYKFQKSSILKFQKIYAGETDSCIKNHHMYFNFNNGYFLKLPVKLIYKYVKNINGKEPFDSFGYRSYLHKRQIGTVICNFTQEKYSVKVHFQNNGLIPSIYFRVNEVNKNNMIFNFSIRQIQSSLMLYYRALLFCLLSEKIENELVYLILMY